MFCRGNKRKLNSLNSLIYFKYLSVLLNNKVIVVTGGTGGKLINENERERKRKK